MVRFRQLVDRVRHRLLFVPLIFIVLAIAFARLSLRIDAGLDESDIPKAVQTTVAGARSILAAIAGGLISSVTLLLSLMLVAVQLASSQFSPRTLRNWTGDRTQQRAIGFVLGTVVYCLLILRETRSFEEGDALTPHLSVIMAVALGISSLIMVLWSVDQLTDRLRVGSIAAGIAGETVAVIESNAALSAAASPGVGPLDVGPDETLTRPHPDALAVVSSKAGWVQQIDVSTILSAVPAGSTIHLATGVGSFVFPSAPVAWIWPQPDEDATCTEEVLAAIAIGDTRTMQQDIGFGFLQMVDIALRALSPGVNDPNTANDMVVHLGVALLALWERELSPTVVERDGKTLVQRHISHGDYLHAAMDPIRLYGANDPSVAATVVRTLSALRSERVRRDLPGPSGPLDDVIAQFLQAVNATDLAAYDKESVRSIELNSTELSNPGSRNGT